MLVTGRECLPGDRSVDALVRVVRQAVEGGVTVVQLREKDLDEVDLISLARRVRSELPENVPLLVNGPPAVLKASEANGLHLPEHAPAPAARDLFWGRSIHSVEAARNAEQEGARYVIAGAIFPTRSHPGSPAQGLDFLQRVCEAVSIPVLAIGGIQPQTAASCIQAGAAGIAVRSPILSAPDPTAAARLFRITLDRGERPG